MVFRVRFNFENKTIILVKRRATVVYTFYVQLLTANRPSKATVHLTGGSHTVIIIDNSIFDRVTQALMNRRCGKTISITEIKIGHRVVTMCLPMVVGK